MRVDPPPLSSRPGRVRIDRPATMRDPNRAPLDVLVRDLSRTGALLETEGSLAVGTLVSLGVAGAGMQMARVVRHAPNGLAIEFMLPIDATAVAAAGRRDVLVSVAFPQLPVPMPNPAPAQALERKAVSPPAPAPTSSRYRAPSGWPVLVIAAVVLLLLWLIF